MFWRVGVRKPESAEYRQWLPKPKAEEGVFLMQKTESRKERKVPVMGTKWWNKTIHVRTEIEFYTETEESELMFRRFNDYEAFEEAQVPEIAVKVRSSNCHSGYSDYSWTEIKYNIPVSEEGVAYLARNILESYTSWQEELRAKEEAIKAEKEAKERLFGDYPPKTLVTSGS